MQSCSLSCIPRLLRSHCAWFPRLQQQVMELEGRLRELETLAGLPENSSAFSQCQEDSAGSQGPECSSATSQCPSTSESLPESPSSQRCGSAPPHYPPGFPRPYQCHGPALRKASDPEGGAGFLRGRTRASTGNLSHCGPGARSSFVRRKYRSISLRRVRRTTTAITPFAGRQVCYYMFLPACLSHFKVIGFLLSATLL